jgi:asparagine synthase (glutamine-hydrolysing)
MFNYDLGSLRKYAVNGHAKGDFKLSLERFSPNAFDNWLYNMTFKTMLPSLLHYSDRNSMAFTIESRVPFLDHRLVEFMFTTDFSDKINHKAETKYLLRQSLKGILPEKVTNRRDKKGFVTPGERVWLRGPLRHFLDIDYDRIYWLDRARLKAVIDNYRNGDNSKLKLVWNIASLNQWMKKYA